MRLCGLLCCVAALGSLCESATVSQIQYTWPNNNMWGALVGGAQQQNTWGGAGWGGAGWGGWGGWGGWNPHTNVPQQSTMQPWGGWYWPQQPQQQQQQQQQQPAVAVAAPAKSLWVCLEDIFPANIQAQAGLTPEVGRILSSYVTHAYVLHGHSVEQSTAWQFSLDQGMSEWMRVLMGMKGVKNPTLEWGKQMASKVEGTAKVSTVQGSFVYANSQKCFHISESKCTDADIQTFSTNYRDQHPKFNLLNNNCVYFACNVLSACSSRQPACDAGSCIESLAFQPMEGKNPGCGATVTMDNSHAHNNNLGGDTLKLVAKQSDVPTGVWDFLPMHSPEASKQLAALLAKENENTDLKA